MLTWEYLVVSAAVVAAAGYLLWALLRHLRAEGQGCGSCATKADSGPPAHLIPREDLRLRRSGKA
jgi:hypothetical protein